MTEDRVRAHGAEPGRIGRRGFIRGALAVGAALGAGGRLFGGDEPAPKEAPKDAPKGPAAAAEPIFRISLAEWSLHRALGKGDLDTPGFVRAARDVYGLDAVEYVNSFLKRQVGDPAATAELGKLCADTGVKSLLIMCDGEGRLGDPDEKARATAIENHRK